MIRWLVLALAVWAAPGASEETVVLGLSQDRVAITTQFDGSELLIFGAIKREVAIPDGALDVIVTLAGPSQPVVVRRKERRFGIWVNTVAVPLKAAPSFYAVASSAPLDDILTYTEDLRHAITTRRAIRDIGAASAAPDVENYTEALIRLREAEGTYLNLDGAVRVDQATLFRVQLDLPSALVEGAYATRIFLLRDGAVIAHEEAMIDVRKEGLERLLFALSREQPLVYGLLSLVIAVVAGWGAAAIFRALRAG
jgi:uncharacterized protein (TIGR02186 family)